MALDLVVSQTPGAPLLLMPRGVVSGGRENEGVFWGLSEHLLNVDTQKLGLWPGGFLTVLAVSGFEARRASPEPQPQGRGLL